MQVTCKTTAIHGVEARLIDVQCLVSRGLFGISIVGMPERAVREAKERIMATFYANAIALPPMKITFNLSPADIPKYGNHYDLPMAAALLANLELLPKDELERFIMIGALALDGQIESVNGVLATALEATKHGAGLICPEANLSEALMIPDLEVICPQRISQLIAHFRGHPIVLSNRAQNDLEQDFKTDMSLIKGMEFPKRALEIAAAGRHHLFMVGSPGAGKSLLASALPSIMPPMTAREAMESTLVHSVAGLAKDSGPVFKRPYYDPHHTASAAAIVGGGPGAGPGEISLAHRGVLFLDELPEFKRDVLESLRQPLETGEILVARANAHYSYPARFLLVAAANPCNCGMLLDPASVCAQAPICGAKYMERISGPLLDRFSLRIIVPSVDIKDIQNASRGETSATVRKRVTEARKIQYARNGDLICNEDLDSLALDGELKRAEAGTDTLLNKAAERFNLSIRGYYRMIKTARTIADLEGAEHITRAHIGETALYRVMEDQRRNYDNVRLSRT